MSTPLSKTDAKPFERRVMAIAAVIALHLLMLALAAASAAAINSRDRLPNLSDRPLLITVVAMLLADCTLGAIWWSQTRWPAHAKTLIGAVACAGLWILLISTLESASGESIAAACWAAALAVQVTFTTLACSIIEIGSKGLIRSARQFSILYLLLWTALVASMLGVARHVIERNGWTLSQLVEFNFFQQLQTLGIANAMLGASLFAAIRLPRSWQRCALVSMGILVTVVVSGPFAMAAIFFSTPGGAGAGLFDLAWLWLAQGLFLLAALIPLEIAREPAELAVAREAP